MSTSDCSSFEVIDSDDEEFHGKMFVGEVKPETDDKVLGNLLIKKSLFLKLGKIRIWPQ